MRTLSKIQTQRFATAFNVMCRAAEIDDCPFNKLQKQLIFDQLALACSELGENFSYSDFEDACAAGLELTNPR